MVTRDVTAPKAFDATEWFNMLVDPLAFASTLKPKKPDNPLDLIALGDQEVPNPTNSTSHPLGCIRAEFNLLYRPIGACILWVLRLYRSSPTASSPNHSCTSHPPQHIHSAGQRKQKQVAEFIASDGK